MTGLQRGRIAPPQPKWLRTLAMLCVLLVGVVSTAQAAHVHGEWLPHHGARLSLPTDASPGQDEEHCPLCVAMHSTLPVTMQVMPVPLRETAQQLTARVLAAPEKLWSFAMFSRPPPAAARALAASNASNDVSLRCSSGDLSIRYRTERPAHPA